MKTVVIIGAGPAGLTAGYELSKNQNYNVVILEESENLGGISRTVNYKNNRMDIGGHRFFSKSEQIMNWWNEIMPIQGKNSFDDEKLGRVKELVEGGPDPEKEDCVMLKRQRVSRIYYKKKFFDYPISMKPQTIINMGFGTTMVAGFSYLKSTLIKKKEDSLENFYINRFGRQLYSMFFEGYTEKLWGRHPSEISAEWGAQRVKGLSIVAILKDMFSKLNPNRNANEIETSLIEEFYYPKYGPGQMWETVANKIVEQGGTIIKNAKVVSLNKKEGEIQAVNYLSNSKEKTIEADYVISSMPIKDLVEGLGSDVPERVKEVASGLPYRDFVTVGVLVNHLNLKNETEIKTLNDIVPDCWIYVQDCDVKLGRIQIFNNWSPYMVEDVEQKVWIGLEYFCNENDEFWNMSDEECMNYAINELVHMGIIDQKESVLDSHREKVKKAYPAYFDTYKDFNAVKDYLNQFENLFCVGRNGQHRYNNMDHSMMTAIEAVRNIESGKVTKNNIWEVNTEKEYHESK